MVGRQQLADVMIKALKGERPKATMQVLAEIMRRFEWDGTATFARHELAQQFGINVASVSAALNILTEAGAITTRRTDGRRVTVEINPNVATMLRSGDRRRAQRAAPPVSPPVAA